MAGNDVFRAEFSLVEKFLLALAQLVLAALPRDPSSDFSPNDGNQTNSHRDLHGICS